MQEYMPYIWLAVIATAIFLEVQTSALVAIWFIPAAVVTTVLAFFDIPILWQIIIFLSLSLICLGISRICFKNQRIIRYTPTNADAVIGQQAIVTEQICNIKNKGLVKIQGQIWSAKSEDNSVIEANEIVIVVAIEGVKLIVKNELKGE